MKIKKDELTAALMIKKDELLAAVAERDREIETLKRQLLHEGIEHSEAQELIIKLGERLAQLTGECICRTTSCQHGAHLHHNGVCEVCDKGICWC
jgi:hypothetical protein